ncbi:hypothetical protein HK104_002015 [Borealophlyctis nickersoniae]|nr:hypothetical protein HK104_002015 [Borealophlyctis nickersoniae]
MICRSVVETLLSTTSRALQEKHKEQFRRRSRTVLFHLARLLSDLHFATSRFGIEGFAAWRDVMSDIAEWAAKNEKDDKLFADDLVKELTPTYDAPFVESNPVVKSRLLFYLTLSRSLMRHLTPKTVVDLVLPRATPYLAYRRGPGDTCCDGTPADDEDKDLFEMSHALIVRVFEWGPRFREPVKEIAEWYIDLLLENFPDPIDFDLLRRCFTFTIKALSTLSSAGHTSISLSNEIDEDQDGGEDTIGGREVLREDDTSTKSGNEESDIVAERGQLVDRGTADQEEEGDLLALACIAKLLQKIHQAQNNRNSDSDVGFARRGSSSGPESRLLDILAAAPKPVVLHLVREQFCIVLFDQIRTVSLLSLEGLLDAIRWIMIGGNPPALWVAFNGEADGGEMVGLGLASDPDSSSLWKALFDGVSGGRGVDYTRREICVKWYLRVLREARENCRVQRDGGIVPLHKVEGKGMGDLPAGHPLRARL